MLAYTFDLQNMVDDLTQSRAPIEVFADQRTSLSQQTRKQLTRLIELRDHGITVWLGTGTDIQEEYAAAGRKVRPGQGILHAKCVRADNWVVCGSTNWTTCSRCNTEMSVLIQLSADGIAAFEDIVLRLRARSVLLDDGHITTAQNRSPSSRSSRSHSLRRSRSSGS